MRLPWDNWDSYEVGLVEHPIITKTAINVGIYIIGDWLSQVSSRLKLVDVFRYSTAQPDFWGSTRARVESCWSSVHGSFSAWYRAGGVLVDVQGRKPHPPEGRVTTSGMLFYHVW